MLTGTTMAHATPTGARLRWALAGAALATLLVAQSAHAFIPQAQSGGAATRARRACSECAYTDSVKRAREALVVRLDSLRWEVEHRRMTEKQRQLVTQEMSRTVRELEAAFADSAMAAALGQRDASVQMRRPAQAFAYSIETGYRNRGYLGVTFDGAMAEAAPPNPDRIVRFFQYPRIALVEGNSPAERAGVLVGDTVLALNGDDLREREFSFAKLLVPDATVVMRVQRAGSARDLKVKVGETPEYYVRRLDPREPLLQGDVAPTPVPRAGGQGQVRVYGEAPSAPTPRAPVPAIYWFSNESVMGARIETITEGLGKAVGVKSGVLVIRAAPATPAYRAGLRDGDVVIRVGGDDVSSVREFRNALAAREHDAQAKLVIMRDGRKQDVTLRW